MKYRDKDGLIARRVAEVEVAVGRLEVVVQVQGAVWSPSVDVSAFLFTKVDSKRSPGASWHAHPHLLEFSRTFVGKIRI